MTAEVAAYHAEQRELEREAMRRGGAVLCWTRRRSHAPRRDIRRGFALELATNEQVMKRTVADVAAAVGVHRVTVHRWFQHDRRARRRMVYAGCVSTRWAVTLSLPSGIPRNEALAAT